MIVWTFEPASMDDFGPGRAAKGDTRPPIRSKFTPSEGLRKEGVSEPRGAVPGASKVFSPLSLNFR